MDDGEGIVSALFFAGRMEFRCVYIEMCVYRPCGALGAFGSSKEMGNWSGSLAYGTGARIGTVLE